MLDEGKVSRHAEPQVPDISLIDNETNQTPIIIDVCHAKGLKEDLQKVIQLIDNDLYSIREGFVYNYKTGDWLRYRFGENSVTTESSFSEILDLDLNQFL